MSQSLPPHTYSPPTSYAPQPSNGLGLAGFIVSLAGLFVTGGVLCPVGVVLSLIAMAKPPRAFATAGLVIGVLGSGIAVMWIMFFVIAVGGAMSTFGSWQTNISLSMAQSDIDIYYSNNNSQLPDDAAGTQMIQHYMDEWNQPLTYRVTGPQDYELVSAGPDMIVGTPDDIVTSYTAMAYAALSVGDELGLDPAFLQAETELRQHYAGDAPPNEEGQSRIDTLRDRYGHVMEYRRVFDSTCVINGAGPDGKWKTPDDESYTIDLAATDRP